MKPARKPIGAKTSTPWAKWKAKEGKQLFDLLRYQPDAITINPACSTHSLFLDRNAVKKLADGSILGPALGMKLYTAHAPAYWTGCAALGVFAAAVFGVLHGLLKEIGRAHV